MEQGTAINKWDVVNNPGIGKSNYRKRFRNETNLVFQKLVAEGCESFYNYFESLDLIDDPNIIILPSTGHYFYDAEDMKEVKTVINMKQLNQTKQIKDFMHNIYHVLSHQCYFIGIFIDKKHQNGLFSNSTLSQTEL